MLQVQCSLIPQNLRSFTIRYRPEFEFSVTMRGQESASDAQDTVSILKESKLEMSSTHQL